MCCWIGVFNFSVKKYPELITYSILRKEQNSECYTLACFYLFSASGADSSVNKKLARRTGDGAPA